ncbi:MAG: hypothetical protein IJU19_09165 [Bacteroidales bacterium]|nr:hypothetical protein [Bacteroidales bacterium]
MNKALATAFDADFEVVREYINTGTSNALTPTHQRMIDTCVFAYGLLRDFPQRNVCIRKLMAAKEMSYATAAKYVDFARQTWGNYLDYQRDFLESFFLENLMKEISAPGGDEKIRAKNLATLQKYLDKLPAERLDPRLMEQNTVNIQVNVGDGKHFLLNQKLLAALPPEVRSQLLAAVDDTITSDAEAEVLINT